MVEIDRRRLARYRPSERCSHLLGIGSAGECTWSLPRGEESSGDFARSKQEPPVSGRGDGDGSVKLTGRADNGNSEEISAMPQSILLQRIGKIFHANGSAEERADFLNSLERFLVPDRGTGRRYELRVVLLVESPHTDEIGPSEIDNRYPLAGDSGKTVRNRFMEWWPELELPNRSIGKLVHGNDPSVNWLGIMNVCQLPFQKGAYQISDSGICWNRPDWKNYKKYMSIIRNDPCSNGRDDDDCKKLDDAIAEDFRKRLEFIHRNLPDVLLVRCGKVAKAFYTKAIEMNTYLPHPASYRPIGERWEDLNPQQNVCLQNIRGRILPPQAGA